MTYYYAKSARESTDRVILPYNSITYATKLLASLHAAAYFYAD
jgi:hypothetical protein